MSMTAGTLITAAKKRTFGKTGNRKISDPALVEELNFQDTQIVQEISQIAPDLLATVTGTATVSLASNQTGYTLSTGIHYRDFTHVDTSYNYTPITIVQRQWQENMNVQQPAGMLKSNGTTGIFYPIDPQGERWQSSGTRTWFEATQGHTIKYSYVPSPGGLTSLSGTLGSPDLAREALISALELAIYLQTAAPEIHIQMAVQRYTGARASLTFQVYKFGAPQGQRPSSGHSLSDAEWVSDQVGT